MKTDYLYSREPEKLFVFFMNEISSQQLRIYLIKVGTVVGVDINTMKRKTKCLFLSNFKFTGTQREAVLFVYMFMYLSCLKALAGEYMI